MPRRSLVEPDLFYNTNKSEIFISYGWCFHLVSCCHLLTTALLTTFQYMYGTNHNPLSNCLILQVHMVWMHCQTFSYYKFIWYERFVKLSHITSSYSINALSNCLILQVHIVWTLCQTVSYYKFIWYECFVKLSHITSSYGMNALSNCVILLVHMVWTLCQTVSYYKFI